MSGGPAPVDDGLDPDDPFPPPRPVRRPLPGARTCTCKRCGGVIDWKRDGVPFGDGSCAHVACHEREG